jgi:hypothetical protein
MKKLLAIILIYSTLAVSYPFVVFAESPFGGPPQNPSDPGDPTNPGTGGQLTNPTSPGNVAGVGNPTNPGTGGLLDNPTNPGAVTDPTNGTAAGTGIDAGATIDPGTGLPITPGLTATGNGLIPKSLGTGGNLGVGRPNGPGYALYAGGGNYQNFWEYLKSLLSLNGQDNQSTYQNQETLVQESDGNLVHYTVGTTPKTVSVKNTSKGAFCTRNTSNKTVNGYINFAICLGLIIIPIIVSAIVLWFMFGAVRILGDNKSENRNEYKQFLGWGLFIIFIALSFVGILAFLSKTLGL